MNTQTKSAATMLVEQKGTQSLSLHSKVVATQNQLSAQLNGEVVVLNLQSGIYFGLDNVAAHIWSLIQEPTTGNDVAATLYEEYEADQSQIELDVLRFFHKLCELELLEVQA